ncbi:MAG: response regulator [Vicinamibacterales bacterium]
MPPRPAAPAAPTPVVEPTELEAAPRAVAPIVVATADPSLLRMLTFALVQVGLPHTTFTSGLALLERLLTAPRAAHPSVVVLDVDLPGVDGHAILERLSVERPGAYLVVALSSHADESVQVRSLLAGALDHLAKPFNVRVLSVKLQQWAAVARRCEAAA